MDYNEILCQAIETIVAQRVSEISYDQTIVCTIVDDADKANGHYRVQSNDKLVFDAYCENTEYKVDYQVYVLVPNGDYSLKKTIISRYSSDNDTDPIAYVSPVEKVVPMTRNFAAGAGTPVGLTANGATEVYGGKELFSATNVGNIPYDTLCIKADFKCQLQNYLVRSGNYGLRVIITTNNEVVDIELDSAKDMFGNPYGFISYFTQEQIYHIGLTAPVKSIKGYFYQRKNFTYYDESLEYDPVIPVLTTQAPNGQEVEVKNIFINNIEVYFGYDVSVKADNTVEIYTYNPMTYTSDGDLSKSMSLLWFNKTPENKYLGFSDGSFNKKYAMRELGDNPTEAQVKEWQDAINENVYYWVQWYRDNNDGTWPVVAEGSSAKEQIIGTCHDLYSKTCFKARVYCNGDYFESNVLTFTNQTLANADSTNTLDVALTIHHGDYSEDAYPYYGPDNVLINIADARRARQLYFSYESTVGALLEESVLDGAHVLWYIPTAATMLEPSYKNTYEQLSQEVLDIWKIETLAALGNVESQVKLELQEQLETQFNGYLPPAGMACYYTTIEGAVDQSEKTFYYQIKKVFNANGVNNKIKLKVIDKFGYEYNADKSFIFSTAGSCGTDYSLIISEDNGYCSYSSDVSESYHLSAKLYDADFQDITPAQGLAVTYSTPANAYDYEIAKAQASVEWSGNSVQLTAEYPVAWSAQQNYYYQGPVSIVYDSSGVNPQYYNGELAIFDKDNNKLNNVTWEIQYTLNGAAVDQDTIKFLPEIYRNNSKNYSYVKAKAMYMNNLKDVHMTLVAKQNGTPIWGQPILIYQNQYSSSLLNKWGGEMVIDNDNNYILTAMVGAGIKNEDNTFSGVLMGDVGTKAQDPTIPTIGLYGIHEGVQSFGVKIDGTAFLGKSGRGQIVLDGNNGFIYSGNWIQSIKNEGKNPFITKTINGEERVQLNQGSDGMAIDLQYGHIDAFNFKLTSNNVKFDSHVLNDDAAHGGEEEHFYHMNIETNPLDVENQLILRKDEVGFRILDGHKYYLDAEGTQLYTGEGYPQKTVIYEKVETTIYTAVQAADWPELGVGAEVTGGPFYWSTDDGQTFSSYSETTYPTSGLLYTQTIEVSYIRVPDDKSGPLEVGKEYYLDNKGETRYTDSDFPVAPVLYEQVMRGHGHYHIRFKSDGTLELSIANSTMLADKGITLGDLVADIDDKFVYIEDEVIGNPENPVAGTIYDHIAGEIGRIEDEVIGIPPGVNAGNVYSYINGQSYMTSEGVFHGLTDGGVKKGIFYRDMPEVQVRVPAVDAEGNPVYDANGNRVYELKIQSGKELYINANYIRTGILASSNYVGNLIHYQNDGKTIIKIYKPTDSMSVEEVVAAAVARGEDDWDIGTWGLVAEQGTYWNLDNGQLWAAKFELNAWTNKNLIGDGSALDTNSGAGGLYLNSHPEAGGYYLSVGNTDITTIGDKVINPNFIQYSAEGVLKVKMNEFVLQASGDIYDDPDNPAFKGIYLNSSPEAGGYYLLIGQPGNFMSLDAEGKMIFQTNNTFIVNAWHPAGDGHSEYEHGIYMNSDGGITKDIYGNEYEKVYFRAGHGDMNSVAKDESELIEISTERVLISSKHFILDAYDHTTYMGADGKIYEVGGIYLNSKPAVYGTAVDQYLHIGSQERFIQYNRENELIMCVDHFILDAFNNLSTGMDGENATQGLYLNSAPEDGGYYLVVGNESNFIQLAESGDMTFQTNGKFVVNALSSNRGIYFNSQPDLDSSDNRHLYFQVGNGDSYIKYSTDDKDTNGLLSIKGTVSADAGDLAGWKIEWYNSSCGRIYGTWKEGKDTYYLNLWSAFPTSEAGYVAGLYSANWRIQAGASGNGLNGFTNGFGVTREGQMAASEGRIAGWEFKSYGLYKLDDASDNVIAAFLSGNHSEIINGGIYGNSPALNDWGLILGPNFGVSYGQGLFASNAHLSDLTIYTTLIMEGKMHIGPKPEKGTLTMPSAAQFMVSGDSLIAGKLRIADDLAVNSTLPTNAQLAVGGDSIFSGKILISPTATHEASLPVNAQLMISGASIIKGKLIIDDNATINSTMPTNAQLKISGVTEITDKVVLSGTNAILSNSHTLSSSSASWFKFYGNGIWVNGNIFTVQTKYVQFINTDSNPSYQPQVTFQGRVQLWSVDKFMVYAPGTTGVDGEGYVNLAQYIKNNSGSWFNMSFGSDNVAIANVSAALGTNSTTITLKAPAKATAVDQVLAASDTAGGTKWVAMSGCTTTYGNYGLSATNAQAVTNNSVTYDGATQKYYLTIPWSRVTDAPSFAAADHNHAGVYSKVNHGHSGTYAPSTHSHSEYATKESVTALIKRVAALELGGSSGSDDGPEVEIKP